MPLYLGRERERRHARTPATPCGCRFKCLRKANGFYVDGWNCEVGKRLTVMWEEDIILLHDN